MFAVEEFVASCRAAVGDSQPRLAVKEVLDRALANPSQIEAALPPRRAELVPLFVSEELTVMNVVWAPGMTLPPHDHLMWAAIGIYGGDEENLFYRRTAGGLVASGGKSLATADSALLGDDVIHSVHNPRGHAFTGALHIYGGNFMTRPRSVWDPETLEAQAATGETMQRYFDAANSAMERPLA